MYTYDVAGNKTSKKTYAYTTGAVGTVQSTETYSYGSTTNTRNRLTNYNGTSIGYDGVGNPTNWRNSSSLTWEGKDLKSVYLGAIGGVSYTYTAEGLRTQKAQSYYGLTVNYYYDSNDNLIYEERTKSSGTERLHYQYDANGIMGLIHTNASGSIQHYWFGKNAQGDVVDIYNGNGVHVARYNYDAWGVCTIAFDNTGSGIATINPIRYRSYYYDTETSWYYLRTRYYDPGVGRFLNMDSILGANGDLLSYNLYAYCSNNPVNYADPSGQIAISTLILIASIVVGVGVGGYTAYASYQQTGQIDWFASVANGLAAGMTFYTLGMSVYGLYQQIATYNGYTPRTEVFQKKTPYNPGRPFITGRPIGSIQSGVDPNTLTPTKILSSLDSQRIADAVKWAGDKSIQVSQSGVIQQGHHRVAHAIMTGRMLDVVIVSFK